ncbi:unnamed protein product [Adineta steineri]|uniref:Uncharacterized protein n=1 Tax=Adineta steineri TaxID=433720 RepID=A0A818K807_9BILA|nr:unnamed protein product [Adineta steineri]
MQVMKVKRSCSVYDIQTKRKSNENLNNEHEFLSDKKLTIGIIIGLCLTICTIILQCVAFFTPHWKEISPKTNSLYIDGVDALIRTEVLVYFNSVHRFTRHSYGLFQRCEYILSNSSQSIKDQERIILNHDIFKQQKHCTKNFLPSYNDEYFNECHSLQYYRFCSKSSEKIFDIHNDYLRVTFDILSNPKKTIDSTSLCDCHYPTYVKACFVLEIFALTFLSLTAIFFIVFPFLKTRHHCLKIKCFGVLSSILSMLFILINLIIMLSHLEYESTEYLIAIEKHYRSSQIYKLSLDTKLAINRFLSSINIELGYSAIIAWIAFALSIIDGLFFMLTCKIKRDRDDIESLFSAIPMDSSQLDSSNENEIYQRPTTPLTSAEHATNYLVSPPLISHPPPPPPPSIEINDFNNQLNTPSYTPSSCLKRSTPTHIHFEDEV